MERKKEKGNAATSPNSKRQDKYTSLYSKNEILQESKKAIDYFIFKTQFAKNKSFHTKNINSLIDLYNYLEKPTHISDIMDAILLELYLHKVLEIKNEHYAIKKVASIIEYPKESILSVQDFIRDNIIFKRLEQPNFKTSDIFKTIEVIGIETHIQEILNILNNDIKWKR